MRPVSILIGILFTAAALAPLRAGAADLPQPVAEAVRQAGIPQNALGIFVQQIGAARPLLAVGADRPMNPASVMKLITTYAALELLGPAYTWKTEIYGGGPLQGGTLRGDLILKGYGDPRLNLESFWLLLRNLRQAGVREIAGDLVLDASYFDVEKSDPAGFDAQPYRAYNVAPEALLVNYKMVNLQLAPEPEANRVRVVADPVPEALTLNNNLKLASGPCNDWRTALAADITVAGGQATVSLNGRYSAECGDKVLSLSLYDNAGYIHGLFKQLWAEQGGRFTGAVRNGQLPASARLLVSRESPPLAEIVRDINKFSNNVMARQLFLTLGAYDSGPPATLAKAKLAIASWLASKQLEFPELVLENGSGLSRVERISARHLGQLLLAAFHSAIMPEFMSSLPIAAVDGTMKTRLNGDPVAGRAHVKTGLLDGVKAIAGYVLDRSGRRLVVVCLINHPQAVQAQAVPDALLKWVYDREP